MKGVIALVVVAVSIVLLEAAWYAWLAYAVVHFVGKYW